MAAIPAAVPWIIRGAGAAKKVWDIWRSVPADTRQDEVDDLAEKCEEEFENDYAQCMKDHRNSKDQRICIESAMHRRAKCIQDRPEDEMPPLYK